MRKSKLLTVLVAAAIGVSMVGCGSSGGSSSSGSGGSSSGGDVANKDKPLCWYNRQPSNSSTGELDKTALTFNDKTYYVGFDANQGAELQGQMVLEYIKKNIDKIDRNGDGVIGYVLAIGDIGHNDSIARTRGVRSALGTGVDADGGVDSTPAGTNVDGKAKVVQDATLDVDGKTYFTQEDGTFRTGWQEINGQKLYYAENGEVTKNQIVEIEGAKYAFDENGNLIKNAEKDGYKIDENGVATEVTPSEETTPTQDTTTQSQTQAPAQTTTQSAPAQSTTTTTTQAPAQTSTPSAPANDYVAPTPSVNSSAIAAAALAQVGTTQDCTMLVTNALRAVGINFHGWPENYLSLGTITSSPVAGDIIVYSGHVAIYIGNGQAVHGGWNGSQTVVASVSCDKALIGYVHVG